MSPPTSPCSRRVRRSRADLGRLALGASLGVWVAALASCGAMPLAEERRLPDGSYVALAHYGTNPVIDTDESAEVRVGLSADRASFALVHHYLARGVMPPPEAVRVEDCIQALAPAPKPARGSAPELAATLAPSPFRPGWHVLVVTLATAARADDARAVVPLRVVSDTPDAALERALAEGGATVTRGDNEGSRAEATPGSARPSTGSDGQPGSARPSTGSDGQPGSARPSTGSDGQPGSARPSTGSEGSPAGIDALVRALDEAETIVFSGDGAGLGGVDAQAPLLDAVARFRARGGVLSVAARLGPGMDDALLDRLARVGGGLHELVIAGEERELARRLATPVGLGGATMQVKLARDVVARWRLVGHEGRAARPPFVPVGGMVPAGEGVALMVEVKLRHAPTAALGRVRVASDQAALDVALAPEPGGEAHRAVVAVAAFAEKLRGSYWGNEVGWDALAAEVERLAAPALRAELGELVARARALDTGARFGIERPLRATRALP